MKSNAFNRPRRNDRLKASDVQKMQDSIADMQRGSASPLSQPIELVRLTASLAPGAFVDAVIQGYDSPTEEYVDIGDHAKRSVFNPYQDTLDADAIIPIVRVGGAVIPVRGGGGGGKKHAAKLTASLASGTAAGTWIYDMDGMALTYLETATIYDPLYVYAALGSGDWLYCFKQGGKYYAADPANCTGTSPLIDTPPESGPPGEGV